MTPRSLVQYPGGVYSTPQGTGLIMTPRSLIQYPGGVYSMPQGTGFKIFVIGASLLMWMASASNEVEHRGSTMYNTPGILVQLGEHGVHDLPRTHNLPIQPANSPDTKACDSLPLVRQHTCRLGSQPRWNTIHNSGRSPSVGTHPGMPKIVMHATWE